MSNTVRPEFIWENVFKHVSDEPCFTMPESIPEKHILTHWMKEVDYFRRKQKENMSVFIRDIDRRYDLEVNVGGTLHEACNIIFQKGISYGRIVALLVFVGLLAKSHKDLANSIYKHSTEYFRKLQQWMDDYGGLDPYLNMECSVSQMTNEEWEPDIRSEVRVKFLLDNVFKHYLGKKWNSSTAKNETEEQALAAVMMFIRDDEYLKYKISDALKLLFTNHWHKFCYFYKIPNVMFMNGISWFKIIAFFALSGKLARAFSNEQEMYIFLNTYIRENLQSWMHENWKDLVKAYNAYMNGDFDRKIVCKDETLDPINCSDYFYDYTLKVTNRIYKLSFEIWTQNEQFYKRVMKAIFYDHVTDSCLKERIMNDEKMECSICLGHFNMNERVIQLQCSHVYHKRCIESWLKWSKSCPICRQFIDAKQRSMQRILLKIHKMKTFKYTYI